MSVNLYMQWIADLAMYSQQCRFTDTNTNDTLSVYWIILCKLSENSVFEGQIDKPNNVLNFLVTIMQNSYGITRQIISKDGNFVTLVQNWYWITKQTVGNISLNEAMNAYFNKYRFTFSS